MNKDREYELFEQNYGEVPHSNDFVRGYQTALSHSKERIAELEKDAERLANVCFHIERAIDNGCCPFDIEDAYEAMKESKNNENIHE
jgi:hypothetical protein